MKRWFCGFSSVIDSSLATLPQPLDGKMLWEGANSFWVCGNWAKQQIITLFEGPVKLGIVGTCLEPYESLVELFQNAVKKHDYNRLMRLPGSYNLIVQNEADTYVFVDVAGLRPVFYTEYNSCVVYSSLGVSLQQLIKAEVDPCWLANYLVGLTAPNLVQNRSPFCNIQAVPPGHYLQISLDKATCKRYWHGPQEYCSFSEAAEQLREQLLTAVEGRVRLYGNVTSDLSGGFDSTSLALIAAKDLAKQGQKLHTITLKTVSATESEDVKWAQHAASLYPNIAPVMIENHELPGEYSNLESIPLTDAPELVLTCIGQISKLMEIIRLKESQLHMSGNGGDAVLLAPPSYLADLLRRAQIGTFVQQSYGWSRISHSSVVDLMSSAVELSLTSYHQWLLQQYKKLVAGQLSSQQLMNQFMGWDFPPDVSSWYTKKSVDLVVADLQTWATVATPFADSPGQHESIAVIQLNGIGARVQQQIAETYDVNLEFPYFDSLVIDACLCARPEERTNPFKYKPLLSKALHRDLPQSIFTRTTKGNYTTDEFIGFRQNLAVINELFQTSLLADMDLIDIREFHAAMKQFSMGIAAISPNFSKTLAIELWLRRVVDASNSFWI
ncbi:MAG: albusnodin/ikarugamycin family macrolactam cyclase [Tolypothrix carrinoi HA7290-LM1]|jgi:asparagine synthase (glutamine-hydrolysing)|nr:albusnodin/ikarugamycin family macrolactam cyclase [Tolypothrix carrinoi HA7290-LM1]